MDTSVVIVRHSTVRAGKQEEFTAWRGRVLARLGEHPGFLRVETYPPSDHQADWVTVEHFTDIDAAAAWLTDPVRKQLLQEAHTLIESVDAVNVIIDSPRPVQDVTAVITNEVRPQYRDHFVDWLDRIQAAQAQFPGYRGVQVQQPVAGVSPAWVTLLRFDTAENLRNWLDSPECRELTEEAQAWLERSDARVANVSFHSLLPAEEQAQSPPDWKVNMIVLLVLYPIVVLLIIFVNPLTAPLGLAPSTFISNAVSVAVTGFILIPWAAGLLKTWLSPPPGRQRRVTVVGTLLMVLGYAALIATMAAVADRFG